MASIGLVAVGASACGDDSSSGWASAPKAVATIDDVTGDSTAIKLDKGFTDALTTLTLTPGVTGDVEVNGEQAAQDALLFQLDGRTLKPITISSSTATLTGTKVEVSPVAADLLDSTFKTDAVTSGLLVGIATISVDVPA